MGQGFGAVDSKPWKSRIIPQGTNNFPESWKLNDSLEH